MLGFAGFPLTGGMFGKLFVFCRAYDAGEWWLVLVGVAATAISLAYYLNVVRWLYMRSGAEPGCARRWVGPLGPGARHGRGGCVVVTVGSFFVVQPILDLAADAAARSCSSPLPRHTGGSPRRRASAGLGFRAMSTELTWLALGIPRRDPGRQAHLRRPVPQRQPEDPEDEREPERCDLILLTHGHGDHLGDTV